MGHDTLALPTHPPPNLPLEGGGDSNGPAVRYRSALRYTQLRAGVTLQRRSNTAAIPCPPPMHIVTSA